MYLPHDQNNNLKFSLLTYITFQVFKSFLLKNSIFFFLFLIKLLKLYQQAESLVSHFHFLKIQKLNIFFHLHKILMSQAVKNLLKF